MRKALLTILLVGLLAFSVAARDGDATPETPAFQGPDMTLTLDKIAGSYVFWRQTEDGYENGFIEFKLDHSWSFVTHLDRDRDRVTDEHQVRKGEYGIGRMADGTVAVWLREGEGDQSTVSDLRVVGGHGASFLLFERSFLRHAPDEPFFVIKHNQPIVAKELFVESEPPGAAVYIDGVRVEGVTPMTIRHPLAERPLQVKVVKSDFHPQEQSVTLARDETSRLLFKLTKGEAGLTITSSPAVKVKLDGVFLGSAGYLPIQRSDLPAGKHEIELYNDSLGLHHRETIVLEKGRFLEKRYEFTGRLVIDVGRAGQLIRRDKKAGSIPFDGQVPIGRHVLILEDAKGDQRLLVVQVFWKKTTLIEKPFDSLPRPN
ncbi:MAG: PEGA domain-containing protein [Candidatus Lernaella stagnicola]|nr:PEGA domain-containing protein [Candidatus Lernaella stagnicola]